MSGVSNGAWREMTEKVEAVMKFTSATNENEGLTRQRVELLEAWTAAWSERTLKERIKWLLMGR